MNPRPDISEYPARILIVDDEPGNRKVLEAMLRPEGYQILSAANGEEALVLVEQQPPDLILLDVMMPGMDGYQVTAKLKGNFITQNIPIIIITAQHDRNARMLGLNAGAEDFLTKPVDHAELCVRVKNLLRLKNYGDYCDKYSQMLEAEVASRTIDLVERTKTLEQQAAVLAEQAALLDLARDAIVVWDMHYRILFWSRGAEVMYGWLSKEALGSHLVELLNPKFAEPAENIEALLLLEGHWDGEVIQYKRDGTRVAVASRWVLQRDAAGMPVQVLTINNDITDRKQAEAELRTAKDTAEAANRVKSEFLANMSHELRTPMNGVIGMIHLILDTDLTFAQREDLLIAKSSAQALLTLINQVLDFSRIDAGKFEIDPIDFNFREIIKGTVNTVAAGAHKKGLELIVDVGADIPDTLRGDPACLRRILVSLLGNAIKFTPRGEVVLRVTTEVTAQEVVLHFSIKDTGIGISLDHQKSIIEAFTQADSSMTRAYDGIGLGLTTAAQLVQVMGGRFWLESEVGEGSTFHFTASFGLGAPTFAAPVADTVDLRGLRVLVIDDNATTRGFLEEILNGWRMVPTLAASATEAIAALRAAQEARRSFDLILTDFPMPGADGFVLAAIIEKDPVSADATVVMLSSVRQLDEPGRCRELGMAACIFKPIDLSELRGVFQVTLGARAAERDTLAQNPPREALPSGRILVVEDNIINQLVARRLLETHGHTVLVANSGREALTMLEEAAFVGFDCVFMDLKMPEMDGFECTTRIRDKERLTGSHLPIIGITAYTELGEEARCIAAGMDAFLSKPLQPVKFFDVVDRLLAGSSAPVSRAAT